MELKKLIERLQEIEKKHQDKNINVTVAIEKSDGFHERRIDGIYLIGTPEKIRLWIEV